MSINIITDQNFQSEVLDSKVPILVDFLAQWCGPCRIQGPIIEDLSSKYDVNIIKFGKMNVDENPFTSEKYNIMSIPTLILFKNGKIMDTLIGLRSKEELEKVIQKFKN